jgi:hypothetical protein
MFVTFQSRAWTNTTCTGPSCYPLDDQIGPAPAGAFGTLSPRSLDPNYHREYNMQYSVGVQQQIRNGVTLNFNWIRRDDYQQELIANQSVPSSAWTPYSITNPLDGTPIRMYNLAPSFRGFDRGALSDERPSALARQFLQWIRNFARGSPATRRFHLRGLDDRS